MDEIEIRLECLRLAAPMVPRGATEVVAMAKEFEGYVTGQASRPEMAEPTVEQQPAKRGPGRPKKTEGNPFN